MALRHLALEFTPPPPLCGDMALFLCELRGRPEDTELRDGPQLVLTGQGAGAGGGGGASFLRHPQERKLTIPGAALC